jgi:Tfp pilus assembly protein PilX
MKKQTAQAAPGKCRKNERGAALITVLMISFLLIVAAAALLFAASANTSDVTDATAEEQAYYAAESGIQSVVNVLRGNTVLPTAPADLRIDTTKPVTDPANKIDYLKAFKPCTSNTSCNCTTGACSSSDDNESRLSRWLTYGTTDGTYMDRVILGASTSATQPAYNPRTGFAYKVKIENPDNVGDTVTFDTVGSIAGGGPSKAWGGLTISYVQRSGVTLNVSTGQATDNFGKFVISGAGTISERVRFTINVQMTKPYYTNKVIRGYIEAGTVTNASVGSVKILYDSQVYILSGSTITLSGGTLVPDLPKLILADGTIRTGYDVAPNAPDVSSGETLVSGSITAPEPLRLIIRSTGFGPQNSQKQLEAVIYKNYFNGLSAPSPLTLIGPPATINPTSTFLFNPGTSGSMRYSGKDVRLKAFLPPIGVTNNINLAAIYNQIKRSGSQPFNGDVFGAPTNIADELPFWLQSTENLHKTVVSSQQVSLRDVAQASGRYYGPGVAPPAKNNYGNFADATGITYVDGDLEFEGDGGGILVVTGKLTLKGAFSFNGLILVTGAGGMYRRGGGVGSLQGNMIIAPYLPNDLAKGFLAPKYEIEGGGNSEIVYNSNNVGNGLGALSNFVKGVAEK